VVKKNMQITLISIRNGWLAGLILLFLFSPVSGAGTFCDGIMGPGTWRVAERNEAFFSGQRKVSSDQLKAAIRAYVEFENSSSRAGGAGAQRVLASNWRELAHAAEAINLSKDELEQLVAKEILRQAGARAESSRVVTQESIRRADQVRKQQEQVKNSTIDGNLVIMHRIEPGRFMMGEGNNRVPVILTKMPEIMAFPTTQIIYKTIAELANKRFPQKYQINPDPSKYKGDTRPVERVSYEDAEEWVDALNDLSDAGEPALQSLISDHKKGMRYGAFITEAQREYLMKKAKTEDGDSIDEMIKRNDIAKLKQYAAFGRSSSDGTVPVDQCEPLFIDGKPFYGLSGNVWEWVQDAWDGSLPLKGGTDPVGTEGSIRVIRGGSWFNLASYLRSGYRYYWWPGNRFNNVGFRLVRTAK